MKLVPIRRSHPRMARGELFCNHACIIFIGGSLAMTGIRPETVSLMRKGSDKISPVLRARIQEPVT